MEIIDLICFCCNPKKEDPITDILFNGNMQAEDMNYQNDEIVDGVQSLFPSKYIREDERKHLKFSKDFIINYLTELCRQNFINKYDEKPLKLSILDNNELSDNTPIIRCQMIFDKTLFKKKLPTLEELIKPILDPELRLKFDKNFAEFNIIQKINENTQITKMISSPKLNIEEKEFYDKKTFFIEDGELYYFCSSIPDNIFPSKNDSKRVLNYLGAIIIKEDNENFYFDSFNQVDIKMSIPEITIVMNFPMKMKEIYDGLLAHYNN